MFLGSKVRLVGRADNLSAISDLLYFYFTLFTLWRRSALPVRYELDCYCYK
jgi:hypothetical protein